MAGVTRKPEIVGDDVFDKFAVDCKDHTKWAVIKQGDVNVWEMNSDSALNIYKVQTHYTDVAAPLLYDVLHDPNYRKSWDDKMIEGFLIEQLDPFNDVGYYSVKIGYMMSNRDWVNQRSWRVKDNQYMIINHSVLHPKQPEKSGFVRANSIRSGYLLEADADGKGCTFTFMTHNDANGSIPKMVLNWATKTMAPNVASNLRDKALKYEEWHKKQADQSKPWNAHLVKKTKKKKVVKKKKKAEPESDEEEEEEEEEKPKKKVVKKKKKKKVVEPESDDDEEEEEEEEKPKKKKVVKKKKSK